MGNSSDVIIKKIETILQSEIDYEKKLNEVIRIAQEGLTQLNECKAMSHDTKAKCDNKRQEYRDNYEKSTNIGISKK